MCSRALSPRNPQRAFALAAPAAAWLLAAISSTSALAAEAYIQNGIGAREKALAGAGVASSTDATAASLNPGRPRQRREPAQRVGVLPVSERRILELRRGSASMPTATTTAIRE